AGQPPVVVDEVRRGQRVEVRDVVDRDDAAAGGGELEAVGPLRLRGGEERGLEDAGRDEEGPSPRLVEFANPHLYLLLLPCLPCPAARGCLRLLGRPPERPPPH